MKTLSVPVSLDLCAQIDALAKQEERDRAGQVRYMLRSFFYGQGVIHQTRKSRNILGRESGNHPSGSEGVETALAELEEYDNLPPGKGGRKDVSTRALGCLTGETREHVATIFASTGRDRDKVESAKGYLSSLLGVPTGLNAAKPSTFRPTDPAPVPAPAPQPTKGKATLRV